ncbi:MAG TPA: hypothetical protein VNJ01_14345 [Bacteriovoracaceae bacterium]|nr:hypothetical protein [Bacteriovoracaceae bacterium]
MKSLIFSMLLLTTSMVSANVVDKLYPITSAVSVKVSMLCPDGMTCFTNGTVIKLVLPLNGCVDSLGPVTYKAEENREKGILNVYVSATGVANPQSMTTRCMVAPTAKYQITLVNKYGNVKLKFLK